MIMTTTWTWEFPDVVEQEDGYIFPTPSRFKNLQDLSPPPPPGQTPARRKWKSGQRLQVDDSATMQSNEDAYFGVEAVSSRFSIVKRRVSPFVGRAFIKETPTKVHYPADEIPSPILYYGPDARDPALATDGATDLDYDEPSINANR